MKFKEFFESYKPEIGIVGGIAGMWVAAGFSIFATVKVVRKLDRAKEEKGEELTFKEKLKVIAPWYAGPAVLATVSTVSAVGGVKSELTRTALIASAAKVTQRALDAQEEATKEIVGEEKAKEIRKKATEVMDEKSSDGNVAVYSVIDTGEGESFFCDPYLLPGVIFTGNWQKIRSNVNDLCAAMVRGDVDLTGKQFVTQAYGLKTPDEAFGRGYFGAISHMRWNIYSNSPMPDIGDYPDPVLDDEGRTVLYITHYCEPRYFD